MFHYSIHPESEIPIYRQLVDQINAEIRSGALPTGAQLPTVREMAERMNLSCGTVKRVYDCLQEMGDIEMTRRRGTFVKYVREDKDSRKIRAMVAIDKMIKQLTDLHFSPAEIHIFVSLKMREWGLKWSGIRIGVITEYVEMADYLEKQLNQIGNVTVVVWQLKQVRDYPYNIDEQSDVILASAEDIQKLNGVLPDQKKLIKVAFNAERKSMAALMQQKGAVGVFCRDETFGALVKEFLPDKAAKDMQVIPMDGEEAMPEGLHGVVVAEGYEKHCGEAAMNWLQGYDEKGKLIRLDYGIDEGSMIYLEERINRIRDDRQIRPGGLGFWQNNDID